MRDDQLHQLGLKVTVQRRKILETLEGAESHHLTAEAIYGLLRDNGDDIGLATVYRVLTQFEQAGLVKRLNFDGGHAVFELESDEHHDHLVCVKCGKVEEFLDEVLEKRQLDIAKKKGFVVTDHSLVIYGVCENCTSKAE